MLTEQRIAKALTSCLLGAVVGSLGFDSKAAPSILITHLPAYGSFHDLAGVVLDASPAAWRVAVFIFVPGYGWVTKPMCDQPLTVIQPNGSWTADITTGGTDQFATRIAALLVGAEYNQPCVEGLSFLPTNVLARATASVIVERNEPGLRWISFSGYDWWVKASAGQVGPGPNYFSDSTNNVWLDSQGRLHLRITHQSSQWRCAEIVTARTFGYGHYRFELDSRVDDLDPSAVLGLFTWSDDPAYAHREIDIECARWSNATDTNNAQYVVQPHDANGHLLRLKVPASSTNSTHLFSWETNRVGFQSQRGSYSANPEPTNVIGAWTYTLAVPQSGDENVRINLWLNNSLPPTDNTEVEVVIRGFEFVPLGPAQSAVLKGLEWMPGGQLRFTIDGQVDRRYQVQSSTNLLDWQNLASLLATNSTVDFLHTISIEYDRRFFRTVTLP